MNALYKRIVTLGMISVTALLGWVYCIISFKSEPVYIVTVSLVLIFSIYVLLSAVSDLHAAKEADMRSYIESTAARLLSETDSSRLFEDLERLEKASYVQIRNTNTLLAKSIEVHDKNHAELMDVTTTQSDVNSQILNETINKAVKILVKYNENNNAKLVTAMNKMREELENIMNTSTEDKKFLSDSIDKLIKELVSMKEQLAEGATSIAHEISSISISVPAVTVSAPIVGEDIHSKEERPEIAKEAEEAAEIKEVAETLDARHEQEHFDGMLEQESLDAWLSDVNGENLEASDDAVEAVTEESVEPSPNLDDFFAEFGSAEPAEAAMEEPAEAAAETAVAEPAEDSNRQLSPDEIAALFEASKEEYRAKSEDDFKVEDHPDSMDQSLIDNLLGNMTDEPEENIIQFPAQDKEPAAPVNDDPNRQLSPDEIAALFASAGSSNDDTKKEADTTASSDEVTSEATPAEETPVAAAPVNDDPNRQLSPDEIAALFASMQ